MNRFFLIFTLLTLLLSLLSQADSAGLSIPLTGDNQQYYTAILQVTSARTELRMLVDSSSSDTWFASTWCSGSVARCGKRRIDCTPSVSCYINSPFKYLTREGIKRMSTCYDYPPGCINATVVEVPVGFKESIILDKVVTAGMLNYSDGIFGDSEFDGILGMGRKEDEFVFDIFLKPPQETVFEDLIMKLGLTRVFYVYFHQGTGALDLGIAVESHYKEPLKTYPGVSPVLWMLLAEKIKYHDTEWLDQACEFNTGWPRIGIPDEYYNELMKLFEKHPIPETEEYEVPCLAKGIQYPDLELTFDGTTYRIPANLYIAQDPTGKKKFCRLYFAPSHRHYWILGIPWFEQYYTGFNFDTNQISIAEGK